MEFKIYQPKSPTFTVNKEVKNYKMSEYNNIYSSKIEAEGNDKELLEKIFCSFQGPKPEGYKGHSLSVGDIVYLNNKYYICNTFGWLEVELA